MGDSIVKRAATSLLVVFAAYAVTFLLPNWAFCLLTILFIGTALHEFFSIIEKKGLTVYKYFGSIMGILIPIGVFLHLGGGHANLEPLFIVMACLFLFVRELAIREKKNDHLTRVALTLFALFYVSWFFSFFIKIKFLDHGAYLVAFLILVTKVGDIGAYFIGKRFGRRPLIPRISPKKTREGAIGGLASSVLVAFFCRGLLPALPFYHAIFLGMLLGVVGQVGDLAESLFKRDFEVKDASSNLPGLGGVLDVIDSLLFTTPIFYFYVKLLL